MEFNDVIKKRYSCRMFKKDAVEQEKLEAILEAGRRAPTAKNLQPFRILLARSEKAMQTIDGLTRCRYGAPVVLVLICDTKKSYQYHGGKYNSGVEDVGIVATHLMLAAENLGLNTCWVNAFDPEEAEKALGVDENEHVVMMLDIGYKTAISPAAPQHLLRKKLKELVTEI